MPPSLIRKPIRLPPENYLGQRTYFVTICCHGRRPHGSHPETADWLIKTLRDSSASKHFLVHAYCMMPDHLHLLAEGATERSNLLRFVKCYKQITAYAFKQKNRQRLWQYNFYDHILRKTDASEVVAWYIWMNPVRKCLCSAPQDYPFSGSFTQEWNTLLARPSPRTWLPPWKM